MTMTSFHYCNFIVCEISGRPMSNIQNCVYNVQWGPCKIEIGLYYDTTKFSFTHWF